MTIALRAASGGINETATTVSQATTLPTGTVSGDIQFIHMAVANANTLFTDPTGYTRLYFNSNFLNTNFVTCVWYRVWNTTPAAPTISWTGAGKLAWTSVSFSGTSLAIDNANDNGFHTDGITPATITPNPLTANRASVASVLFVADRSNSNVATAMSVTPPTNWTEPTNGDQSTIVGTTSALRQINTELSYRLAQSGTVTPGSPALVRAGSSSTWHVLIGEGAAPAVTPYTGWGFGVRN